MTTPEDLRHHVNFLCNIQPPRNTHQKDSLAKASGYIHQQFAKAGLHPQYQNFTHQGQNYHNVIARQGDPQLPTLVIGAHYDVCQNTPGADDNASAVAVLLSLAHQLAAKPPEDLCLEFVSYPNEEPPHFGTQGMGSFHHAQHLAQTQRDIRLMICLEMVGFFQDQPNTQELPPGYPMLIPEGFGLPGTVGNFIVLVSIEQFQNPLMHFANGLENDHQLPLYPIIFPGGSLAYLSDHINYWHMGFPALMVNNTSFLRNPHYHAPTDLPHTLDYQRMALLTQRLSKRIAAGLSPH